MRLGTMLLGLMLIGCGGGESERLMDTGWFDDTASFDPALVLALVADILGRHDGKRPIRGSTGGQPGLSGHRLTRVVRDRQHLRARPLNAARAQRRVYAAMVGLCRAR